MKSCCTLESGRAMGLALMRWGLGLLLLVSGCRKLAGMKGFVTGYLGPAFENTVLPSWLVTPYGYALPVVEALLGVFLLIGLFRSVTLFVTGLTFLSLAFGQMLLKEHSTVTNILFYLFVTGILLFLGEHDRWALCGAPKPQTAEPGPEADA